ncbi:hypothetical protein ACFXPA_46050 [Amycolatopsis sp. NPDC059090]
MSEEASGSGLAVLGDGSTLPSAASGDPGAVAAAPEADGSCCGATPR